MPCQRLSELTVSRDALELRGGSLAQEVGKVPFRQSAEEVSRECGEFLLGSKRSQLTADHIRSGSEKVGGPIPKEDADALSGPHLGNFTQVCAASDLSDVVIDCISEATDKFKESGC